MRWRAQWAPGASGATVPAAAAGTRAPVRPSSRGPLAESPLLLVRAKSLCRPWLRVRVPSHGQGHPRTPGTNISLGPVDAGVADRRGRRACPPSAPSRGAPLRRPRARTLGPGMAGNLVPASPVARPLPADQYPASSTAHDAGSLQLDEELETH